MGMILLKHTPLYRAHQQLGARLIEFGGWEMPVYYTSIMEEHQAVRTAAGLFDVLHMGEIRARGSAAFRLSQRRIDQRFAQIDARPGSIHFALQPRRRRGR